MDADAATYAYANVSPLTGVIVTSGMATLRELDEFYSLEDALNMAEIIRVNNANERAAMAARENAK